MKTEVFAVVLTHDQPELLSKVLANLSKQTVQPDQVLVVDTSKTPASINPEFQSIRLPANTSFASAIEEAVKLSKAAGFLWLLHDDSIPFPDTLEKLLREVELSPSLAVVGPKQLEIENQKIIKQLGLTLTKSWRLLGKVKDEFDQGQHDTSQDVLAVGTAGSLIRLSVYRELLGFDSKAPVLASDVDFSIRARLSGHRVSVAPEAKVLHGMLSLSGKRPLSWLGAPVGVALRRAELHLMLSYLNLPSFLLLWLFLVPLAVLNSFLLLISKRARSIVQELAAAIITFVALPNLLSSRNKISKTTKQSFKTLSPLLASSSEVRQANRRSRELLISQQLIKAHAAGIETETTTKRGVWWWAIALAALNSLWLPTNIAVTGAGTLPLGDNWLAIFSNAGARSISLGLGISTPSDPWHWVLALLSAPTFFAPSLALVLLLFFSTAIAFLGAFKLTAVISAKHSARVISAMGFALWPALTLAIGEVRISQAIALSVLPWLLLSLAKLLKLGHFDVVEISSPWRQVGLSAALFAVVSASSPVLGVAILVLLFGFSLIRPRRLLHSVFVPGLALAWWLPLLVQNLSPESLISLLLDPGVLQPSSTGQGPLLFGYQFGATDKSLLLVLPVLSLVIVGLLSYLVGSVKRPIALWLVAAFSAAAASFAAGISFDFGGEPISVSNYGLLGLLGLALWLLAAHLMDQVNKLPALTAGALVLFGIFPSAFYFVLTPPDVTYSDGRIVPSIIQAEANAGTNQNTLVLSSESESVVAEVFFGDGQKLEDKTTRYNFLNAEAGESEEYLRLGQLVANLVSANGALLTEDLSSLNIGYILVKPDNLEIQMALDSTNELESIGDTDFGQLWKVRETAIVAQSKPFDFGFIKISQLALLGFYLVLALPTGGSRRRNSSSEIFKDVEENN